MINAMKPRLAPSVKRRLSAKYYALSLLLLTVAVTYTAIAITRPFAQLQPSVSSSTLSITTPPSQLPWPAYGQGAFGLSDGKVIATHGEQAPVAIASAAKVITALVVLERRPVTAGTNGPTITLNSNDVALYNQYVAKQGSVMPVASGQKLTERQMLEAMLLPSANNIADSLAIWSYGSLNAYLAAAKAYLAKQGLTNTQVGTDASGYSPDSTSTATDLVKLGSLAMQNSTVAGVVAEKTASINGVGTVRNVNTLLGSGNIVGVKTGNNDQNGGVFIGASTTTVNGKPTTVVTALSGAPSLTRALSDSAILLAAAKTTFAQTNVVTAGTVLGTYHGATGDVVQAVAAQNLSITVLRGSTVKANIVLQPISYNTKAGATVGKVSVAKTSFAASQSVPIVLKQAPAKPTLSYRLLNP